MFTSFASNHFELCFPAKVNAKKLFETAMSEKILRQNNAIVIAITQLWSIGKTRKQDLKNSTRQELLKISIFQSAKIWEFRLGQKNILFRVTWQKLGCAMCFIRENYSMYELFLLRKITFQVLLSYRRKSTLLSYIWNELCALIYFYIWPPSTILRIFHISKTEWVVRFKSTSISYLIASIWVKEWKQLVRNPPVCCWCSYKAAASGMFPDPKTT